MPILHDDQFAAIASATTIELSGTVLEARGLAVRVADLPAPVGAAVRIVNGSRGGSGRRGGATDMQSGGSDRSERSERIGLPGEVVGFDQDQTVVMPLGATTGVKRGDRVIAGQFQQYVPAGDAMLGRVINALGEPIDGRGPLINTIPVPLVRNPVDPMDRPPIDAPLATGVRAIDAMLSVGRGQRLGIFASPGLGKSTLLAMMARHTAADVVVIGLVGERGREVRDFLDNQLGEEGLANSVVVCATGDEPPLLRIRAALAATAVAEHFRAHGKDVLLLMDSVTRLAQAQRQVGLAAGEPPATRGYPPSVFNLLPTVLERCGRTTAGSITGFYAVLVEGDELTDPIADATRGILDGHIQLSADLAHQGHWPAIDVISSVSRVVDDVTDAEHRTARQQVLSLIHHYRQVEELLNIGAYAAGSNPDFDLAIAAKPAIDQLLRQGRTEQKGKADFNHARGLIKALMHSIADAQKQLQAQQGRGQHGRPSG